MIYPDWRGSPCCGTHTADTKKIAIANEKIETKKELPKVF